MKFLKFKILNTLYIMWHCPRAKFNCQKRTYRSQFNFKFELQVGAVLQACRNVYNARYDYLLQYEYYSLLKVISYRIYSFIITYHPRYSIQTWGTCTTYIYKILAHSQFQSEGHPRNGGCQFQNKHTCTVYTSVHESRKDHCIQLLSSITWQSPQLDVGIWFVKLH